MAALDADPLRCFDPQTSAAMVAEVDRAHDDGDTLGGVVEVLAYGVPPGLGSYVHWDRRLDAQLAAALMGIQAIKGVEVGDGFLTTTRRGSEAHDELVTDDGLIERLSDKAGGTEGGMSTGTLLRVRAGMKPISTVPRALRTVDVATGEAAEAHHQRSDVCAVPAAGVVAEAMVALVLAERGAREVRRRLGRRDAAQPRRLPRGDSRGASHRLGRRSGILGMSPTPAARADRTDGLGQDPGRPAGREAARDRLHRHRPAHRRGARPDHRRSSTSTGEPHFRELEREAVAEALASDGVVSLGGRRRARSADAGAPGALPRSCS